jgi:hypothetical protein
MNQKYTEVAFSYLNPMSKTISMTARALSALLVLLLIACGGSDSESSDPAPPPPPPPSNNAPIAQAGADQAASVTVSVLLDGSASTDADNDPLIYAWSLTDQPATSQSIFNDSMLTQPSFTPDVAGTYTVELTVSDGTDTSPADQVIIAVSDNSAAQIIGASGGEVVSADGLVTLTIPAGALASDENISITRVTIDQQDSFLGDEFDGIDDIQSVYNLTPEGLVFDAPITVTLQAEGNPVIDETTMGGPFQILSSSDGTKIEVLGDMTLRADAGMANITLHGTLEHFSPLVYFYFSDIERTFRWEISGVPDTIDLGATTVITASVESVLFILSGGTYVDDDSQLPFQNASTLDINLNGTGEALSAEITYRCIEVGEASYSGQILVTIDSELFSANRSFSVIGSKQVTCLGDNPPPSTRLLTGINPSPSGLTSIEALQIGKFLDLLIIADTVIQSTNDLIALFTGIQGWSMFNLTTNELVTESIDQSRTDPIFGTHLASSELANGNIAGMLLQFGAGTFGSIQCNYDPATQAFGIFCQLSQGTGFDAVSVGNSHNTTQVTYATSFGVGVIELDPQTEIYTRRDFVSLGTIIGEPRSAVRADTTGPLLAVSQSGSTARLSLVESDGTVTDAGSLPGEDARKLRCVDNLCVVSIFDDGSGAGALRLVVWDGITVPTIVDTPITVGNGPVGTDLIPLANGNYLIVSTGFNDNTVTLTEVTPTGLKVSSNTSPAPTGCSQPAHAVFYIPSAVAEEAQIVGTCFANDQYFVLDIVSGTSGFEIVSLP